MSWHVATFFYIIPQRNIHFHYKIESTSVAHTLPNRRKPSGRSAINSKSPAAVPSESSSVFLPRPHSPQAVPTNDWAWWKHQSWDVLPDMGFFCWVVWWGSSSAWLRISEVQCAWGSFYPSSFLLSFHWGQTCITLWRHSLPSAACSLLNPLQLFPQIHLLYISFQPVNLNWHRQQWASEGSQPLSLHSA